jgi:ribose 5-phosphate isomerase A
MTTVAEFALTLVADGMTLGLGSGRAATAFVKALGARVRAGLRVRGVPTSQATADLAAREGVPLVTLAAVEQLDLAVDGADEVDPHGNLIKGLGGALVREKIVAAAAQGLVILVGPEKLVPALGARGVLPVEVVPFALPPVQRRLADLGIPGQPRQAGPRPLITDNGNHILDARVGPIGDPERLELALRAIPGVVGTGLFLGLKPTVLVQRDQGVEEMRGT